MPSGYLKMRNKFIQEGYSRKEAEKKAAKIWNATHKGGRTVGKGRD